MAVQKFKLKLKDPEEEHAFTGYPDRDKLLLELVLEDGKTHFVPVFRVVDIVKE